MKVTYVEKCKDFPDHPDMEYTVDFGNTDIGKALNFKANLKKPIDESVMVNFMNSVGRSILNAILVTIRHRSLE